MKAYATIVSVYTIPEYTLINTLIIFQINPPTTNMREKGAGKYVNAHTQAVGIEFSRRSYLSSTLRTFCKLKVLAYNKARQSE